MESQEERRSFLCARKEQEPRTCMHGDSTTLALSYCTDSASLRHRLCGHLTADLLLHSGNIVCLWPAQVVRLRRCHLQQQTPAAFETPPSSGECGPLRAADGSIASTQRPTARACELHLYCMTRPHSVSATTPPPTTAWLHQGGMTDKHSENQSLACKHCTTKTGFVVVENKYGKRLRYLAAQHPPRL